MYFFFFFFEHEDQKTAPFHTRWKTSEFNLGFPFLTGPCFILKKFFLQIVPLEIWHIARLFAWTIKKKCKTKWISQALKWVIAASMISTGYHQPLITWIPPRRRADSHITSLLKKKFRIPFKKNLSGSAQAVGNYSIGTRLVRWQDQHFSFSAQLVNETSHRYLVEKCFFFFILEIAYKPYIGHQNGNQIYKKEFTINNLKKQQQYNEQIPKRTWLTCSKCHSCRATHTACCCDIAKYVLCATYWQVAGLVCDQSIGPESSTPYFLHAPFFWWKRKTISIS